ncbi:MAG: hypothetical protein B6U72_06985 [Candidatus Altiarchaeales archaeon ex4484_2]|nr:MAG: hypothetical protein B6U72_06985 [Candidatus Altiarchaeales archaeon ex4484_2]
MYVTHPLIKEESIRLRRYQEAVVARAIEGNTMVVLPTGLGKTIIAAMIAAHRLYTHPDSKILFLAPTRPLAVQHKNTFDHILKIKKSVVLTGRDPIKKRADLFRENRMIFATPQTIENDIMRGMDLSNVSLIIFDECHRSVGNYSYVHIAEEYTKKARNPLITGLTASPSSDRETIKQVSQNLHIQQIEAKTEHDRDVKEYIKQIETKWIKVELPPNFQEIKKHIENLLRDELRELKKRGYLKSAQLTRINKKKLLGIQSEIRKEITQGIDSYQEASITAAAIKINHALELLETQGIHALDLYLQRMGKQKSKAIKKLYADVRMKHLIKRTHELRSQGIDHPKLGELTSLVKEYRDRKVLVFTQYRDTVDWIIEKLNENDILAHEFIGQAPRGMKKGMSQKKQIETIKKFRQGAYTALVATSVAEEGIDIPKVDLVVFYEPVPSEIRSIQRRGRTGRTAAGKVVVLMAKGTRDEGYYWAAVHKERKMRKLVREMGDTIAPEIDENQRMLSEFVFEKVSKKETRKKAKDAEVKIYLDVRERNTRILTELKEKTKIDLKQLPVGDYILSDRIAVERKTQEDFLSSIVDNRLFPQARELSENFDIPLLIIEGSQDLYTLRNIHPNALRAAIASLAIDLGIAVIYTRNEKDTAEYLYQIAKREQIDEGRGIRLRGSRKPLLLRERQRYVIESLPNVSSVLAKRLLDEFQTVEEIMKAPEDELRKVEGIGEKKAKEIRKVLKAGYGKK